MNKLKFKLISNDEKIIDEEVNYFIKNNVINFKIKDNIYQYNRENAELIKKDKEKELVIKFKELVIIITMIKENIKFDYPMMKSNVETNENIDKLEYTLDSGEIVNNTIFIEF